MISPQDLYKRYGLPGPNTTWLTLWHVPDDLQLGVIPRRIYCHKELVPHLSEAFCNIIQRGLLAQLKTWDGCWNVRPMRGYEKKYKALFDAGDELGASRYLSIHSWGLAIDINAFENGLGQEPRMSPELVACFTDAGFDWGGTWKRRDGMHFQVAHI